MMKIKLQGLRLNCVIGIDGNEQHCQQAILLDITLTVSPAAAAVSANTTAANNLALTPQVDYAAVAEQCRTLAAEQQFGLLEDFVHTIAKQCLSNDGVNAVCVYACKPKIMADLEAAGVELTLSRTGDSDSQ